MYLSNNPFLVPCLQESRTRGQRMPLFLCLNTLIYVFIEQKEPQTNLYVHRSTNPPTSTRSLSVFYDLSLFWLTRLWHFLMQWYIFIYMYRHTKYIKTYSLKSISTLCARPKCFYPSCESMHFSCANFPSFCFTVL